MNGGIVTTRLATSDDLGVIAELFDAYRQFYKQDADKAAARQFLEDRQEASQSVLICAERDGEIAGFTQLYPSFSSVSMKPTWILNDLYVAATHRRAGVGETLLDAAKAHARETGAAYLLLSTSHENTNAQALYEANGWKRDMEFRQYAFRL